MFSKKLVSVSLGTLLLGSWATPVYAAGFTQSQVSAVIGLLRAFNADEQVVSAVAASLGAAGQNTSTSSTLQTAPPPELCTTAESGRGHVGATFSCVCPRDSAPASVWGTDIYSDDSSICSAALHAGILSGSDGGEVRYTVSPGLSGYIGTTRNGITSKSYASWFGSFSFSTLNSSLPKITTPEPPRCVSAISRRKDISQTFTCSCAPYPTLGAVWGSDTYTDDSNICTAAIHAGLITTTEGGLVSYTITPAQSSYTGTTRNGITTGNYGLWLGSFQFANAAAPFLSELLPAQGPIGATMVISGRGFTSDTTIAFGTTAGIVPQWTTASQLGFVIPQNGEACSSGTMCTATITNPGTYDVSVSNARGKSNSLFFTVTK